MLLAPILPDGTVIRRTVPRSLVALAALGAGFITARHLTGVWSLTWFSLAAACCAAALVGRGWVCRVGLTLAVAGLGAGWFAARIGEPPANFLARLVPSESVVTVEGVALESPRVMEHAGDPLVPAFGGPRARLALSVRRLVGDAGARPARGIVWVRGEAGRDGAVIRAGDRIVVTGVFTPVEGPRNPGEVDRRLWSAQDGRAGVVRVPRLGELRSMPGDPGVIASVYAQWLRGREWLAERARGLLLGDAAGDDATRARGRALLAALVLGEDDPALSEMRSAFNRLGLAHVLSISGFHIAVMCAVGLLLLRAPGDLGWLEPVLIAGMALLYLAILPFNAPVWRSALMVLGLLGADALGRRYDRLTLLGWIAVLLLLWRPMDLWSLGFQLSFGLVALLLWMGTAVHGRLWGVRLKGQVARPATAASLVLDSMKKLVSTNLLCSAAATPIVMYATGLVSPLAVLTGIVVVPLIMALLVAAYAAVALGVLAPPITGPASDLLATLAGWTGALVDWLDRLPGSSVRTPGVSALWAAAATVVILYWLSRGYLRSAGGWGAAAAVGAWLGVELWFGTGQGRGVLARIDTLSVGDGTCHLVRCGRQALVWDCGSLTPGVGRVLVPRAARALGVWRAETVVITHPNLDHFNGVPDIIEPLGVRRVLIGEAFAEAAAKRPWAAEGILLARLRERGVGIEVVAAGDTLALGGGTLRFVSPPRGAAWPLDNDRSIAAVLTVGAGREVLFCGDIQDRGIAEVSGALAGVRPQLLEAPHHGSARGAAVSFITDLAPAVVVQSTGPARADDPRWRAARRGTEWLCTATDGAAWVEIVAGVPGIRSGAFRR